MLSREAFILIERVLPTRQGLHLEVSPRISIDVLLRPLLYIAVSVLEVGRLHEYSSPMLTSALTMSLHIFHANDYPVSDLSGAGRA